MTEYIIETHQRTKSFKGQAALRGLDLRVPAGSIFGFLGRNGAGKTTTIKTLMGLLRSDSGTAEVFGIPVADADPSLYRTVEQMPAFPRPFFPKWRTDLEPRYLDMFDLPPRQKIPALSKGM